MGNTLPHCTHCTRCTLCHIVHVVHDNTARWHMQSVEDWPIPHPVSRGLADSPSRSSGFVWLGRRRGMQYCTRTCDVLPCMQHGSPYSRPQPRGQPGHITTGPIHHNQVTSLQAPSTTTRPHHYRPHPPTRSKHSKKLPHTPPRKMSN